MMTPFGKVHRAALPSDGNIMRYSRISMNRKCECTRATSAGVPRKNDQLRLRKAFKRLEEEQDAIIDDHPVGNDDTHVQRLRLKCTSPLVSLLRVVLRFNQFNEFSQFNQFNHSNIPSAASTVQLMVFAYMPRPTPIVFDKTRC